MWSLCLRIGFSILFEGRSCAHSTLVPVVCNEHLTKTNLKNKVTKSSYPISILYLLVWGVSVN